jgi:hypothetical protein
MNGREKDPPSHISIEHGKNGGFIVEHRYDNSNTGPSYRNSEKYPFSTHDEMIGHIAKHTRAQSKAAKMDKPSGREYPVTGISRPAPPPKRRANSKQALD